MANVVIPQPGVPYVKASIGKEELTLGPDRRLMSFNYTRSTTGGGSNNMFTLVLLDTQWTVVEDALFKFGINGMNIEYGWYGSQDPKLWTKQPIGMGIQTFTPEIFDSYAKITITGFTKTDFLGKDSTISSSLQKSTFINGNSVSEILKKIYEAKGFDCTGIEQTAKFPKVHCSTDSSKVETPIFLITGESALQLWNNELKFRAIEPKFDGNTNDKLSKESKDGAIRGTYNTGRGGYCLYFMDDAPGPPKVFLSIAPTPQSVKDGAGVVATYDYPIKHKGAREVISFDYTMNFPLMASAGGLDSTRGSGIDPVSGVPFTAKTSQDRTTEIPNGVAKYTPQAPDGFTSAASVLPGGLRGRNAFEGSAMLQGTYAWKDLFTNRGTLTLLGRTDLKINDRIQMNVWAKYLNKQKQLVEMEHYATGVWAIREIVQVITPGVFTTKLDLQKISGHVKPQTGVAVGKGAQQFTLPEKPLTQNIDTHNDKTGEGSTVPAKTAWGDIEIISS